MNKLLIESYGKMVLLKTDSDKLAEEAFNGPYIHGVLPDIRIQCCDADIETDFNIGIFKGKKNVSLIGCELQIGYEHEYEITGFCFPYMLEPIIEKLYEEKGAYSIFSAGVSRDGKGIMILGEKASGKSTLSLELLKHDFSLIGDERCLLSGKDQPYLIGGNRLMVLRNDVLEREGFEGERASENKKFIDPSKMGMAVETKDIPIVRCFEAKFSENPYLRHYSQDDAALKLAKILSRGIRGFDAIMLDFDYQMPSLDKDELSRKRIGFAKLISRSAQFDEIHGDIEYLTGVIENSLF